MPALLISHQCHALYGAGIANRINAPLEILALPADKDARLPETDCARVEAAFFSQDMFPDYSRQFFPRYAKRQISNGCMCSTSASIIQSIPRCSRAAKSSTKQR